MKYTTTEILTITEYFKIHGLTATKNKYGVSTTFCYYQLNKEKYKRVNERSRKTESNKISRINAFNKWHAANPEYDKIHKRVYVNENREEHNRTMREWHKQKVLSCPQYRINKASRSRITGAIRITPKGIKYAKTSALIGCTSNELKIHLERLFLSGMSWDNYGGKVQIGKWHIDHIKPVCSFDLTILEQQLACFNYKNLQPLWSIDNRNKGSQLNY